MNSNIRKLKDFSLNDEIVSEVKVDPVDNHGEKIATITVNGVATEISANGSGVYVHLNGDSNIGPLSLSSTLIVGNNSHCYGQNSTAFGIDCQTGAKGFLISQANKDENKISCIANYIPDDIIGLQYSLATSGAAERVGKVTGLKKINDNIYELTLDTWHYKFNNDLENTAIYFPDNVDIGNEVLGKSSHCEGQETHAYGNFSHAEGYQTQAGKFGHAEGKKNIAGWAAHVEGQNNVASNVCGHTEGRCNINEVYSSHVEGIGNKVAKLPDDSTGSTNGCTHVGGVAAESKHAFSYVWSGVAEKDINYQRSGRIVIGYPEYQPEKRYISHAEGSFNINPINGISGIWIGETPFNKILESYVSASKPLSGLEWNYENTSVKHMLSTIADALGVKFI